MISRGNSEVAFILLVFTTVWWDEILVEVCSFEVSIFSVRGGVVYIILHEDDT